MSSGPLAVPYAITRSPIGASALTDAGLSPDAAAKTALRNYMRRGGGFEVRYWSPVNTPVLDHRGRRGRCNRRRSG